MLFDSHAHLNDELLINRVDEIISEAKKNGIVRMTCVGYDYDSSLLAVQLADQYDEIYAAIGLHPSEVKTGKEDLTWMEDMVNHPKVVAIGEIGLDYYWDRSFKEKQKELFIKQIAFANEHHKPIIIHMRDATEDTYEILKQNKNKDTLGVMHCYSSSKEAMQQFIDLDISHRGICGFEI
ncbi:MAG TPA: TatD family hydrolase, partial [Bacillota bacterium]|nr:TatD family hydrolase [Bacillota bacterium]